MSVDRTLTKPMAMEIGCADRYLSLWLFPLRGRWLRCLMLALVACVLWGVCLSRAARLWLVADDAYRQTGSIHDCNDLNWATFIGVSYLLCIVVPEKWTGR